VSFLIDTCALSELVKSRPSSQVLQWFVDTPKTSMFVSVLTLGEIRKGIMMLGKGRRRLRLNAWLEAELPMWLGDRILPLDANVADMWGRLMVRCQRLPVVDGLIAATALSHSLTVVTRNEADLAPTGVELVNPWKR